jgi:hypothetical protein
LGGDTKTVKLKEKEDLEFLFNELRRVVPSDDYCEIKCLPKDCEIKENIISDGNPVDIMQVGDTANAGDGI